MFQIMGQVNSGKTGTKYKIQFETYFRSILANNTINNDINQINNFSKIFQLIFPKIGIIKHIFSRTKK